MKLVFSLFLLFCLARNSSAQDQKTTIFCTIAPNGDVDYGDLKKLLPDSIKSLLVDPKNEFKFKKGDHVLLWMTLHGWKLVTVESNASGMSGFGVNTISFYLLSREIGLDDKARAILIQQLERIDKK